MLNFVALFHNILLHYFIEKMITAFSKLSTLKDLFMITLSYNML